MILDKTILKQAILDKLVAKEVPTNFIVLDDAVADAIADAIATATLKLQDGTINMTNVKKAVVQFITEFDKVPRVSLTISDTSSSSPYVTAVTTAGFSVNFTSNYTGSVDWIAIERS
jgi:hypothetical protein